MLLFLFTMAQPGTICNIFHNKFALIFNQFNHHFQYKLCLRLGWEIINILSTYKTKQLELLFVLRKCPFSFSLTITDAAWLRPQGDNAVTFWHRITATNYTCYEIYRPGQTLFRKRSSTLTLGYISSINHPIKYFWQLNSLCLLRGGIW
jgi:hypothetical protein